MLTIMMYCFLTEEVGIPRKLGQDNVLLLVDRYVDFLNETSVVLLCGIVPEGNKRSQLKCLCITRSGSYQQQRIFLEENWL